MEWKQVVEAVVPKAVETAWDSTEASICMDKNHSNFTEKIKTLCAVRDDLKDRTTKYKSTMKRTMDDWFQRVNNVEMRAQELESCFSAIKDTSAWIHVFSRTKLSRKMTSMCSDIDQLVMESNQLWDTLVHKVAERAEPDLDMIGIPEGAKGSKIVMTTKFKNVMLPLCYNIEVEKLSPLDSWNMFHELLALPKDVKEKPQLERIARKALEICDGLPLMIKMAARVFKAIEKREHSAISWSDGLQTFKRWPEKRENNMMKNLLKFCCDHLDHEQKPCFLYSALHPEDTEISMKANYDVIFKLSGLEELIIDVDSEVQKCSTLIDDLVQKVSTLPSVFTFQLCLLDKVIDVIQVVDDTVKIYLPTQHHMSSFLERRQDLETHSFQVFIGCFISHGIEIPEFHRYDRYAKYYNGRGYNDVINKVLHKVQAFELNSHNDIEHLSGNAIENMDNVKGCLIESCHNMRAIVVDDGTLHRSLLPNMERLDAKNLPKLENIWEGQVPLGSLSKLKTLVLVKCPKLTDVIVHQLPELQHLEIQDCGMIKDIVTCSQDATPYVIPKLTTLIFCEMPSLRKICPTLVSTSLRTLKIHDCPALKEFPFNNNSAMTLQKIEIEKKWWEALRWPDSEFKEQLESFCSQHNKLATEYANK
ncbi:hypothetical protein L1987_54886 [Smallanthus sonchifolius]|uniref:Uncharacterized protein n=1 Tax=Smallanthus sonchifolius TaxID=185202 RepID=A0ACB9E8G3_9ASTR|nr:hypothetical protein L1987_54886 [Smallanthus sonchifolius]